MTEGHFYQRNIHTGSTKQIQHIFKMRLIFFEGNEIFFMIAECTSAVVHTGKLDSHAVPVFISQEDRNFSQILVIIFGNNQFYSYMIPEFKKVRQPLHGDVKTQAQGVEDALVQL